MKYELVVIWDDGTKETAEYKTQEEAEEIGAGFETAFGGQVVFWCVNPIK